MTKYETIWCRGHFVDDPSAIYEVKIALGDWDEEEDADDESIFYYMDGEPLKVGTDLDGFVITEVDCE
jgi:hypothetical protein